MRRKGEVSARQAARRFPHHVDLAHPDHGFGAALLEMHGFCAVRGIDLVSGPARFQDSWRVLFCFPDEETADAFAARFGGVRRAFKPR